jgi:hypothetical protein
MGKSLYDDFSGNELDRTVWDTNLRQPGTAVNVLPEHSSVQLTFPGNAAAAGPSHSSQIGSKAPFPYGRFSVRMKAAKCEPQAETVSSFFTYWHGEDSKGNNHEIDIEILGSEPEILYFTVWTHADKEAGLQRRITRVVDLRQGNWKQSVLTEKGIIKRDDPLAPPPFPETGSYDFSIPDFNAAAGFFNYAFEWREDSVKYFIEHQGKEHLLWNLEETMVIPTHPAPIQANLWWSDVFWKCAERTRPPADPVFHTIDWIRVEPL